MVALTGGRIQIRIQASMRLLLQVDSAEPVDTSDGYILNHTIIKCIERVGRTGYGG